MGIVRRAATVIITAAAMVVSLDVAAEEARIGQIDLNGLARDMMWPFMLPGENRVMVCGVRYPDGYLSIRSGPSTDHDIRRRLNRLATVVVDTSDRQGDWVRVVTAHRTYTIDGEPQDYEDLHVEGWAHSDYLCDFLRAASPDPAIAPENEESHSDMVYDRGCRAGMCWESATWDYDWTGPAIYLIITTKVTGEEGDLIEEVTTSAGVNCADPATRFLGANFEDGEAFVPLDRNPDPDDVHRLRLWEHVCENLSMFPPYQ